MLLWGATLSEPLAHGQNNDARDDARVETRAVRGAVTHSVVPCSDVHTAAATGCTTAAFQRCIRAADTGCTTAAFQYCTFTAAAGSNKAAVHCCVHAAANAAPFRAAVCGDTFAAEEPGIHRDPQRRGQDQEAEDVRFITSAAGAAAHDAAPYVDGIADTSADASACRGPQRRGLARFAAQACIAHDRIRCDGYSPQRREDSHEIRWL